MKRSYFLFLAMVIPLLLAASVFAAEPKVHYDELPFTVNPIYADIFTAEELQKSWEPSPSASKGAAETASSKEEMVEQLRTGLTNFDPMVEISFNTPELYDIGDLFDEARAHTGVPNEGDYINYNYSGYSGSLSYYTYSDHYEGTFTYNFTYLHSQQQEIEATAAFEETFNSIHPADGSDYSIALAVYNYLIDTLEYDYEHYRDDSYKLKHSSYSAVVQHVTVCQGYASMMYRLLLMFDVNNRVASSNTHAWNLISVNGDWYQADATWGDTGNNHDGYFLKGKNAWTDSDHVIITTGRADPGFVEHELLSLTDYSAKPLTESISITDSAGTVINSSALTVHDVTNQFSASALPAGAGQDFRWDSGDTGIATVNNSGQVTFRKSGTVRITVSARDKSGITAYFNLTYVPWVSSITIKNKDGNSVNGKTFSSILNPYQFSAEVLPADAPQKLLWSSNDTAVAGVNSTGKVTFSQFGKVRITAKATDGSGKSASFNFTLLPATTSITIKNESGNVVNSKNLTTFKNTYQFTASAAPSNAMQEFTWTSGNKSIATVTSAGKVTFAKAGTVKITVKAKDGSGKTAYFNLTLPPKTTSITIKNESGNVVNGKKLTKFKKTYQFTASAAPSKAYQKFTWISSNKSIAKVTSAGKVTFLKPGTVKITVKAKDGSGKTAYFKITLPPKTTSITIKNESGNVVNGKKLTKFKRTYQFTASAAPSKAYQKFTWTSSNKSIAKVTSAGKVTFLKPGTVKITVKAKDGSGKAAYFKITLPPKTTSITIKNGNGKVVNGKNLTTNKKAYQLTASAAPAKAYQKFTWTSSNKSIAKVSSAGKVTFLKPGTVKITVKAKDGSKKAAYFKITYTP